MHAQGIEHLPVSFSAIGLNSSGLMCKSLLVSKEAKRKRPSFPRDFRALSWLGSDKRMTSQNLWNNSVGSENSIPAFWRRTSWKAGTYSKICRKHSEWPVAMMLSVKFFVTTCTFLFYKQVGKEPIKSTFVHVSVVANTLFSPPLLKHAHRQAPTNSAKIC